MRSGRSSRYRWLVSSGMALGGRGGSLTHEPLLLVSEQVGWGVVPPTAICGLFRDRLGSLEDRITPHCQHVWLVVAGRALDLLPITDPVPPE